MVSPPSPVPRPAPLLDLQAVPVASGFLAVGSLLIVITNPVFVKFKVHVQLT